MFASVLRLSSSGFKLSCVKMLVKMGIGRKEWK